MGKQPDYPSCSLRPHDQNVLPQCAQGRAVCLLPLGERGKNRKAIARAQWEAKPGGRWEEKIPPVRVVSAIVVTEG